jgi:hypothetical protein
MTTQRQLDLISEELLLLIDSRVEDFIAAMPAIERRAFERIQEIAKDLEIDSRGRIKPSVANVKIVARVKQEITRLIATDPAFKEPLKELTSAFKDIDALQQQYFAVLVKKYSPPRVLQEIRLQVIDSLVESFSRDAVSINISNQIRDVLVQNVTTGGSYTSFLRQIRTALTTKETSEGVLSRYAKTITTDSLNIYSRQYKRLVSQDLGLVWFKYVGSLRETSRPFCRAMIEAKADCMPYVHISQFPELLRGVICGKQTPLSKKTGLPVGMKAETNVSNFQDLAGGHSCNHELAPVSAALVPKSLRDRYES